MNANLDLHNIFFAILHSTLHFFCCCCFFRRVTAEKNAALLRNAEISQQMEMVKQDTRRQEMEMNDTASKLQSLEDENRKYKEKESKGVEHDLRNKMTVLEEQLSDKNKVF